MKINYNYNKMRKKLRNLDFTAIQPNLVIKGEEKVKTEFGGLVSVLIFIAIMTYAYF
jgi:hypothetical protein